MTTLSTTGLMKSYCGRVVQLDSAPLDVPKGSLREPFGTPVCTGGYGGAGAVGRTRAQLWCAEALAEANGDDGHPESSPPSDVDAEAIAFGMRPPRGSSWAR